MVLRSGPTPVNRALARFGAPFFAWMWLPSTTARDHSISPACCNRLSSCACSSSQTPAACHSSRRRRHVAPEPNPSSSGRCRHAIPVYSTNNDPAQRLAITEPLPARIAKPPRLGRQQRLQKLPQPVRHIPRPRSSHRHPLSLTTDTDGFATRERGPFILIPVLGPFVVQPQTPWCRRLIEKRRIPSRRNPSQSREAARSGANPARSAADDPSPQTCGFCPFFAPIHCASECIRPRQRDGRCPANPLK